MDVIELPVVAIDAPLTEAIAAMKKSKRSAIIAKDEDRHWLFKAGQIVVGKARDLKTLGDIEKRWPVHPPSIEASIRRGVDFEKPYEHQNATEAILDHAGMLYALTISNRRSVTGPTIQIITRHETLAAAMGAGPADCYCTNPNLDDPHSYKPPPIPAGGNCRCGYAIVCS